MIVTGCPNKIYLQLMVCELMKSIPKHILAQAKSGDLKPSVRIGKSGITENLIAEIDQQLNSKSLVKIKINRGLFEKDDLKMVWEHLSSQTKSVLVLARGNIGILWKA